MFPGGFFNDLDQSTATATWTTGASYVQDQPVISGGNLYVATADYTAGASVAADVAAGNLELIDAVSSIVWGAVSNDNVYATWAEIKTYIENFEGSVIVQVDSAKTIDSSADLTSVFWASNNSLAPPTITVNTGVTLTNLWHLSRVVFDFQGTANAVFSGTTFQTTITNNAKIKASGSVSPFTFTSGVFIFVCVGGGGIENNGFSVIDSSGSAFTIIQIQNGSSLPDNTLAGNAGNFQVSLFSEAGTVSTSHSGLSGTLTKNYSGTSNNTGYTPDDSSEWSTPPTTAKEALDALATRVKYKSVTFDYTDFTPGGAVNEYTIATDAFTLPAGYQLLYVESDVGVLFDAPAITNFEIQIGITGTLGKYIPYGGNYSTAGIIDFENVQVGVKESSGSDTAVKLTGKITGDTMDNLTAGQVVVRYCIIDTAG